MINRCTSMRLMLLATALLALGAPRCSDGDDAEPLKPREPICDHRDAEKRCIGVTTTALCDELFCTAGATCSAIYYVNDNAAGGDGSAGSPFSTLAAAAAKAVAGECIAVAPGAYSGATLAGGVSLLGRGLDSVTITGSGTTPALTVGAGKGGVIRHVTLTGGGKGLLLKETSNVRLEQLKVSAVKDVGIDVRKGTGLTIERVLVEQATKGSKGDGVGLLLVSGATAKIKDVVITNTSGVGIMVHEAAVQLSSALIQSSGSHGVSIQCDTDPTCKSALASTISASRITRATMVGLWVDGAKLTVKTTEVDNTRGSSGFGRGVDIQGGALLELRDSQIHHSDYQGLMADGSEVLLENNRIEDNEDRGVWLQDFNKTSMCKATLNKNQIKGNSMTGVGAFGCADLAITGGEISDTREQLLTIPIPEKASDGVQLLDSTVALVDGVKLSGNKRTGLLLDASTATIKNSVFSGGTYDVVTQNHQAANVILSGNTTATGAAVQATVPKTLLGRIIAGMTLIQNDPIPTP
jgi:Right handed beta helix region